MPIRELEQTTHTAPGKLTVVSALVGLAVLESLWPVRLVAQGQSLVDVAKKIQEQRSTAKPSKVYSNADLPPSSTDNAAIVATSDQAGQLPPAVDTTPSKSSSATPSEQSPDKEPAKSTLQTMHAKAATAFGPRMIQLSEQVSAALNGIGRYRAACTGFTRGNSSGIILAPNELLNPFTVGGYDYLVTLGGVSIANSTTPECVGLNYDVTAQARAILREIDDINEAARRLGLYPGVMRDLFARTLRPSR